MDINTHLDLSHPCTLPHTVLIDIKSTNKKEGITIDEGKGEEEGGEMERKNERDNEGT